MAETTLKAKILALQEDANPSAIRRIERVLPEIEVALLHGVSRDAILKTLREDGIEITAQGFATALYRLRKKGRSTTADPQPSATNAPAAVPAKPAANAASGGSAASKKAFSRTEIRDIARNRPDLKELTRLGRDAAAGAKTKPDKSK